MVQKTQSGEEEFREAKNLSDDIEFASLMLQGVNFNNLEPAQVILLARVRDATPRMIELLYSAANKGHAEAQYSLGYAYINGLGVDADSYEGNKWIDSAIDQFQIKSKKGDAESCYILGNCYREGTGVEINKKTAENLYEKAANKGHAGAQHNLGCILGGGFYLLAPNYEEAVKWWTKAAMQGNYESQYMLGESYELGKKVERSKTNACAWYSMSQTFSMYKHPLASERRNKIYRTLSSEEILKFEKETNYIFIKMSKNKKTKNLIEKMGRSMQDIISALE